MGGKLKHMNDDYVSEPNSMVSAVSSAKCKRAMKTTSDTTQFLAATNNVYRVQEGLRLQNVYTRRNKFELSMFKIQPMVAILRISCWRRVMT